MEINVCMFVLWPEWGSINANDTFDPIIQEKFKNIQYKRRKQILLILASWTVVSCEKEGRGGGFPFIALFVLILRPRICCGCFVVAVVLSPGWWGWASDYFWVSVSGFSALDRIWFAVLRIRTAARLIQSPQPARQVFTVLGNALNCYNCNNFVTL